MLPVLRPQYLEFGCAEHCKELQVQLIAPLVRDKFSFSTGKHIVNRSEYPFRFMLFM